MDRPWRADTKEVVRNIVQSLERNFQPTVNGFNISEIVQGGSLGHGTAIPGKHDIDLVIYSRDVHPRKLWREQLRITRLTPVHEFLQHFFPKKYEFTKMTERSVQFTFIIDDDSKLDVDLLVSPFWRKPHRFCNFLQFSVRPCNRDCLTVCASKWQVQFFKNQPNEVKEYIRRAKAWRDDVWENNTNGKPSSYLMSLLVVKAYEDKKPEEKITDALVCLVLKDRKIDVFWENGPSGNPKKYPKLMADPPRVIDPANPANNVWKSGVRSVAPGEKHSNYDTGDGNTTYLVKNIHTINLEEPLEPVDKN